MSLWNVWFFLSLTSLVAGSATARVLIFSKLTQMTRRRWPTRRWRGGGGGQEDAEEEGGDQRSGEHLGNLVKEREIKKWLLRLAPPEWADTHWKPLFLGLHPGPWTPICYRGPRWTLEPSIEDFDPAAVESDFASELWPHAHCMGHLCDQRRIWQDYNSMPVFGVMVGAGVNVRFCDLLTSFNSWMLLTGSFSPFPEQARFVSDTAELMQCPLF